MPVDEKVVEAKIAKNEKLTDEEMKFVMSYENSEGANAVGGGPAGEEFPEGKEEVEDIEPKGEGKPETPAGKETGVEKEKKEEPPASGKTGDEEPAKKTGDEEPAKEKEKETPGESLKDKVERELEKPDGQEDLTDWTDREKGLFYEMKRSRKRAQKAEEDRDSERFQRIKDAKLREEAEKLAKENAESKAEIMKLLEGDPEEPISRADLVKIVEKLQATKPSTEKTKEVISKEDAARQAENRETYTRTALLLANETLERRKAAGEEVHDLDEVLELGPQIIESNEDYQKKLAKAYIGGKNVALLAYELIVKDPKFKTLFKPGTAQPAPEKKPAEKPEDKGKGKETAEKINKNAEKPKTSGTLGGGGGAEYKDEKSGKTYALSDFATMSTSEFRKVPKHIREWALQQM